MNEKIFDLLKEEINTGLINKDIRPAVHIVCTFNRFELINDRNMEYLLNCIAHEIYVTCSMYDELKEME